MALQAFCDESGNHEQSRVLLVAGYVGDKTTWKPIEQRWRVALAKDGLEAFHSTDCEKGYGEFAGMPKDRRQDIQLNFLSMIGNSPLRGYLSCIVMRHFESFKERIKTKRGKYWYPYFLVFQHILELCGSDAKDRSAVRVGFVFDRQKEFSGREVEIFNSIIDSRRSRVYLQRQSCQCWRNRILEQGRVRAIAGCRCHSVRELQVRY